VREVDVDAQALAYRHQEAGEVTFFYREAGPIEAPAVLLLHGYPTSSHMFRYLIPRLADEHRVIAPDLPGFGYTKAPPRGAYEFTFDNIARSVEAFVDAVQLRRFAVYVFDYGAPVGFRLAAANPERVSGIITQNGNAYEEGLLGAWDPIREYWRSPTAEARERLRAFQSLEITKYQYFEGVPEAKRHLISPDAIAHDQAILDRPGSVDIQLDLISDYKTNLAAYPRWQEYFRASRPPLLAVWGKNDPFFGPAGAEAYRRDIPDAEVHLFDTGHFALETDGPEIAGVIRDFLKRRGTP
jgi:pimeloyl-ACP methyl ester carboxylesterase